MEYSILDSIEAFCQERALSGLAHSSVLEYETILRVIARWFEARGIYSPADMRLEHFREVLIDQRKRYKPASVYHRKSVCHCWLTWLREQGDIYFDPDKIPRILAPKPDEYRRLHITHDEAEKLINFLKERYRETRDLQDIRSYAVATLLFGAGLRISEAAGLQIKNINWKAKELYLPTTKANKERFVPFPTSTAVALRLYLWRRRDSNCETIFLNREGGTCNPKTLARRIKLEAGQIGILLTSHTGRRFCLTRLARVNILLAKQQAGHADLDTTMKYLVEDRETLRDTVRRIDPFAR
jgi:integrase/recombinase XerC